MTAEPNRAGSAEEARLEAVLDALGDPDCRTIVEHLEGPMTADELSERCGIPRSTTYRKLDRLSEASLLDERIEVGTDGRHATRYVVAFDGLQVVVSDDRSIEVDVERRRMSRDG